MIGIMEAGGSKTEFRFGNAGKQSVHTGPGINPYFQTDADILSRLQQLDPDQFRDLKSRLKAVYYYGAGCSHPEQANRVLVQLKALLPSTELEVNSDLLGSARALSRDEPGFVGILGTGSNGCIFDGHSIQKAMVSFGFWLGDEGSGGYLGKILFKDWLKGKIPEPFPEEIEASFGTEPGHALEKLYHDPSPNRTVASLASVAIRNKTLPYFAGCIQQSLEAYFTEIDEILEGSPGVYLHFTGSVAWHLSEEIRQMAELRGHRVGNIIAKPSEHLFQYHLTKSSYETN